MPDTQIHIEYDTGSNPAWVKYGQKNRKWLLTTLELWYDAMVYPGCQRYREKALWHSMQGNLKKG